MSGLAPRERASTKIERDGTQMGERRHAPRDALDIICGIAHTTIVATVVHGQVEWDSTKADENLKKHGVSFAEAATALVDPNAKFFDDPYPHENRYAAVGFSIRGRVLYVVHVERGTRERIISARRATPAEEKTYE